VVRKTAESFEKGTAWKIADDSMAGGTATVSPEVAAELGAASKGALKIEARFSGAGFEFLRCAPDHPLVIPGRAKRVSLWVRNHAPFGWALTFKDSWGRTEADGKKLEWQVASPGGEATWKRVTFEVPADWVPPLSIDGISTHNWERRNEKAVARLDIDQLEVETDITDVDPKTGLLKGWQAPPAAPGQAPVKPPVTPLRSVVLNGTEPHNVFAGTAPRFVLSARNWAEGEVAGTLTWRVRDAGGAVVQSGNRAVTVADSLALDLPLETPRYGPYEFDATVAWKDGETFTAAQPYVVVPVPQELTEAEKDASPYGLNVHSFRAPMVPTFRKAGIIWYRDYAFSLESVLRARGDDNKYAGWPNYPKVLRQYEDNGVRVLPVFQRSIAPPAPGGKPGPSRAWTRDMAGIMAAFPSLKALELDNEYDLHGGNARLEDAINWKNYGLFHKKFGDIAGIINDGETLMVENGRAGIWPERLRRMVLSGDFDTINVANSHHYTGTDAPELNVENHNMGFSGDESVLSFYDQLRAAKRSATADGKPRQHWLTEFGWDTKAGPKVTLAQQAAYLARAYMLLMAAGTEKGFWFFDLDAPTANQFFDGCGLMDHRQLPKPAFAAYAGLTQILPASQYIGTINAGEGTWGYLFRNKGKLVATLWTLHDGKGPAVDFGPGVAVYDSFANPLGKGSVTLGMAPVYAVGVAEDSRWAKQAAYSVESPTLVAATAGDVLTVRVKVTNTRSTPLSGKLRLHLPSGWANVSDESAVSVPPGQSAEYALEYRVAPGEGLGEKSLRLAVSEAGAPLHDIPLRVRIGQPVLMTVQSLGAEPGESDVTIRISNRSARPLNGKLSLMLPAAWSTPTPVIAVDDLKPMEVRDVRAKVVWTPRWEPGEAAAVRYESADGRSAEQPLIPGRLTIYSAQDLKTDGNLKDWPERNRIPAWTLGTTSGPADADLYVAWSKEGLHVALDVRDAKAEVPDPRSFWVGDVLEVFVDTRAKKTPRQYEVGDHQFWLAPIVGEKRAYVGQWKRHNEIPETRFDIPGIRSAVVKTRNGYTLECLIPASLIQGYRPEAGAQLGLGLSLSVKGLQQERQVYWPLPKSEGAEQPASWGTVTLAP